MSERVLVRVSGCSHALSMSNRVVSVTFRHIIDDVIANVRQDFEDMGIEKEVLEELQRSWEAKLVATQVTEFDGAANHQAPRSSPYPATPGTQLIRTAAQSGSSENADGASESADAVYSKVDAERHESAAPEVSAVSHKRKRESDDEGKRDDIGDKNDASKDEIGSDLDDSDDEDAEGSEDMILCLYDKVQRVKNKWKCVLRDGVASIGGRDYLFSKCNGYVFYVCILKRVCLWE